MSETEKNKIEKKKRRDIKPFVGEADKEQTATKQMPEKPETKPEEYPLFKKLDEIKETIIEKEQGIIHQLCRIADAIENKPKDKPSRPLPEIKPLKTQISKKIEETIRNPPLKTEVVSSEQPLMKVEQKEEVLPKTIQSPTESPTNDNVEKAKLLFSNELEDLLGFSEEDGCVKIKPLKYLGSDNFAKIASIIRSAGGEYMSAGRDSHFRIPISSL